MRLDEILYGLLPTLHYGVHFASKKGVGTPKVVCYEPELDHQIPHILAALYNAWIRYQQTIQKALVATHNNLELLAAITSKLVCF